MTMVRSMVGLVATCLVPVVAAAQIDEARSAYVSGNYEEAVAGYERVLLSDGSSVTAGRGLMRSLMSLGQYDRAERVGRDFRSSNRGSVQLANTLGEVLYRTGELDDARREFERAIQGGASDSVRARINLGRYYFDSGDIAAADGIFNGLVNLYNGSRALPSEDAAAVAMAVRYLARTAPRFFNSAVRVYGEASRRDESNQEARVQLADVLLEKLNAVDANRTYREVLAVNPRHPDALLGMAKWARFDGTQDPMPFVESAIEVNPNHVDAHAFRGLLLIESEHYDSAATEANLALSVDPSSVNAMSVLAAARFMQGRTDEYEEIRWRAVRRSPASAELYNLLAEVSARNRLYREAAEFAGQAVAVDSVSWRGYGLLGMNQLRLGMIAEGKANLERSFSGDPFNVWNKNTLDLVDTFDRYAITETDRFAIAIEQPEAELLSLYMGPLAEEAFDSLIARYGFTPPDPVRVEVMPTHDDFSVRTVGLPGIGALGVSFGPVVAMDSPSARNRGDFNWGSTLWHELVHTLTLGLTANRAPRWFAEGLAVYEERRAREAWGADATLSFLMAYRQGRTPSFAHLNQSFVRPKYPEQVVHSYYQASVILEEIEARFGWDALHGVMEAYAAGTDTDRAFREILNIGSSDVDALFDEYMERQYGSVLEELPRERPEPGEVPRGGFIGRLARASAMMEQGDGAEAIPLLEELKEMYPSYAGRNSPYLMLARIYRESRDLAAAAGELEVYTSFNENSYDVNVALADLRIQLADTVGAARALDRAMYISPYEIEDHRRLADYSAAIGDTDTAIRERRAVVALNPVDLVAAHYELARVLKDAGRLREARRSVLRALELAPNYREAQDLLLEIRSEGTRP